jgi:DNA (cytosine-5)-methyltransferase 1
MRYLSVCSGMEAASVAWHPLGWQPVGFSEIEPFPCAILKHRFPNIPNYGSLTEYKQWPLKPGAIDLLVGGTPCQSFSVAGLRKGLDDPRGNLALVFLGLADKLKPRWIVWENVPGVLSSAGGRDFGSFLGALVELGYGFAYRVLDAQHFGVPQRRRRVFVVACLGDWRAPAEVLLESDCVRRDPKKGRAKGQGVAAGAEGGVGADHPEGCWWDGGQ